MLSLKQNGDILRYLEIHGHFSNIQLFAEIVRLVIIFEEKIALH